MTKLLVVLTLLTVAVQIFSIDAALPHTKCVRKHRKIGCYNDRTKPLPVLLLTDRTTSSPANDGHLIVWAEWEQSMHSFACRCAEKARKLKYKVFGLQNFGECWSGPEGEHNFARDGESSTCFAEFGQPNPLCDVKDPRECIGVEHVNYVYEVIEDDPCSSSPCKNGGKCSKDVHGFLCECSAGFTGTTCNHDVNECQKNPCKNGATCVNLPGSYTCICTKRYKGPHCSEPCFTPVVDLGIVVDSSGSVGNNNFVLTQRTLVSWMYTLDIGPRKTHVGIINYSGSANVYAEFDDTKLYDPVNLMLSILKLPFLDGETRTDLALKLANQKLFNKNKGDRPSEPDVLVVITDGKTGPGSAPYKDVLKPLKDKGVRIIAVGVGSGINRAELLEIALGIKKNVFTVADIEKLNMASLTKAVKNSC